MRVVSFDFDYFVKEDPCLDWGHREDCFFLDEIWQIRRLQLASKGTSVEKMAPFIGSADSLISLAYRCQPRTIYLAESHREILDVVGSNKVEMVNIDAHHDYAYPKIPKSLETVNCGNWGSWLFQKGQVVSWRHIYPDWRKEHEEDSVPQEVNAVYSDSPEKLVNWKHCDAMFICRSGCWVPPEYDARLERVCRALGVPPLPGRSLRTIGFSQNETGLVLHA